MRASQASSSTRSPALNSILASPLPGCRLVAWSVGLVNVGNLGNERVVRVRVRQHGADGQQNCNPCQPQAISVCLQPRASRKLTFADGQSRAPLVTQDIQANTTVRVDIWVIDTGREVDLGGLERIVGGEMNGEEEYTAGVRRVALQSESVSKSMYSFDAGQRL